MKVIGYSKENSRNRYGVLISDLFGNQVQDRQRCARTLKEGTEIALADLKEVPLGTASIYTHRKGRTILVKLVR